VKTKTHATQRSLAYLRKNGWQAAIVEKWIPPRGKMKFGVRVDVWSFGDILACRRLPQALVGTIALVQTFPLARWKDHAEKLAAIPELQQWKTCGGTVIMHGWAFKPKDGVRGARKTWQLREEVL
jgi:hypothetical protein